MFSLLAMASSASAASAGSSMISKYISKVRADLRRQRPEAREAWLRAEVNSMKGQEFPSGQTFSEGRMQVFELGGFAQKELAEEGDIGAEPGRDTHE